MFFKCVLKGERDAASRGEREKENELASTREISTKLVRNERKTYILNLICRNAHSTNTTSTEAK